jgi:short subunit dehydrogenase
VGIPRCLRDSQARRESQFLDFSALRLFHSPTRADFSLVQRHSFRAVMPQALRAVSNGEGSVQMLMHLHTAASQGGAPTHRFNLQAQVLNAYRVVAVDGTLELQREDQIQISAGAAHKRTAALRRRHLKASIELGDVVLAHLRRLFMSFKGKNALITGSSRGIGRGIALKLAEKGVRVAVHYYQNRAAAEATLEHLRKLGAEGMLVHVSAGSF